MASNIRKMSAKKRLTKAQGEQHRREIEEWRSRVRELERRSYELIGRAKLVEERLARTLPKR